MAMCNEDDVARAAAQRLGAVATKHLTPGQIALRRQVLVALVPCAGFTHSPEELWAHATTIVLAEPKDGVLEGW